ncbi:hypothetical protein DS2_13664 [Catenovulum agarivorans DS-2]|uniref:Xanthine dehydrogenase n=1 Tax=Catenovulum agarivorans DS-2 TaxID=1328313 RepID=W7QJR1_9ALTE|nr:XdhC/CoxI family protein [Catenovulum agarivorans]EWH09212.1 hypothetical protein DS2_13664 [Catenovulum agarivorans DS-2]
MNSHNHVQSILQNWLDVKDQYQWALASVIEISGSSYRKPGAIMLINNQGRSMGMLSGGCLEADIILQAQKAIFLQKHKTLVYDTKDDGASPIHFLGCGGSITVLIQPLNETNHFQYLPELYNTLTTNKQAYYHINTQQNLVCNQAFSHINQATTQKPFYYQAQVHLAIFGAGLDAIPMVKMAQVLGWQVSLFDYRSTHVGIKQFPQPFSYYKQLFSQLPHIHFDAAIVMGHNLEFDAQALSYVQSSNAKYIGMLGPKHRQEKVIDKLPELGQQLTKPLYGPLGLDIGGELPEEIALSTLAEVKAVLANKQELHLKQPLLPSYIKEKALTI